MLKYLIPFILFIVIISCKTNEQNVSEVPDLEIPTEDIFEELVYDEHQFFDDLEYEGFDSLANTINNSDKIIAYNWNSNDGNSANVQHHIVDAYGNFDSRIGKNFALNSDQKKELKLILTDTANFNGGLSMCFIPHIAFVYYKKDKIIGQSNVCFMCSGVKSIPKSTFGLSEKGIVRLKTFCQKTGLTIYDSEAQLSY